MSSILEPANDLVLVVDLPKGTTIDGIDLRENIKQQEMVFGTVVFVGPQVTEYTKPTDRVCYGPYAGKTVVLDGVEFRLLREGQIEAYVREKKTNAG